MIGGLKDFTPQAQGELFNYIYGRLPRPTEAGRLTGRIADNGTISAGSGFTIAAHGTTGQYDITFDTAYAATPAVQVTGNVTTFSSNSWAADPSTTGVSVYSQTGGIGPVDAGFTFTVLPTA